MGITKNLVEAAISRGFLAGRGLRKEDAQKAEELLPLLEEIERFANKKGARAPLTIVDACAGRSALGVLAAALALGAREGPVSVVAIERVSERRALALAAARELGVADRVTFIDGDVGDAALWPRAPDLVVALHACGRASDLVIDGALAADARALMVVPCCYAGGPRHGAAQEQSAAAQQTADAWSARVPLPDHGLIGRRFAQAIIDAERTLRLEAAGYETEVVEIFSPTISPYNFLWRARRVREPVRMQRAREKLDALRLTTPGASSGSART